MLKKIVIVTSIFVLLACASEPSERKFSGTGDFDTEEAAKTRVSLGLTYLKNGNFSQAKFNLDKALDFAPRSGEAHYAMAFYYEQVDEINRAEEYYKSALALSQNDPDVLNSYGAFLCKRGRYEDAKNYFLLAVEDKSYISTAETYENLAICSDSQGKTTDAIAYFNSALNHQPNRGSSLMSLAKLYVQQGQWDDAKQALWKYERNASVNADSLYLSYRIAQGQYDSRAAKEYAELLRRLYPNSENTKKALATVNQVSPQMTVRQKMSSSADTTSQDIVIIDTTAQSSDFVAGNTLENEAPAPEAVLDNAADNVADKVVDNAVDNAAAVNEELVDELTEDKPKVINLKEQFAQQDSLDISSPNAIAEELKDEQDSAAEEFDTSVEDIQSEAELALSEAEKTEALLAQKLENTELEAPVSENESATKINILDINKADASMFHVVKPKENLYRISLQYNVKIQKLLDWNNLEDASNIQKGTRLWIKDPNSNE